MNASDPNRPPASDPRVDGERLSQLAAQFHEAWKTHRDDPKAVDLAAFLPPSGDSLRSLALHELVPLDLAARWKAGVPLSLEDYVQRFPELGPLDAVSPRLIAEEHRIRALYGVVSPQSVLRDRFPAQFDEVQRLIGAGSAASVSPSAPTRAPAEGRPAEYQAMLLSSGQIIGDHYQLNKLIGRGGFGEVWHATDLRGSIDKAVKVLTRSADSEEAQKELESLNIIKKINHPCLLRTESYFVEKDRLLIVLELADATLRDLLKSAQKEKQTGIPSDSLLTYMRHAAEGLDYLHKQGILHRDVKPENILIVGDYAKMADFGLAKEAHNKQSTKADFAGTVVYSAPETWDGRVTTRSDQYSLAATYYEMRTGRILFGGKTFQEVFFKHMEGRPDLAPLPELEQDVLRTALSKKPEERYTTCTMFVRELVDAVLASGSKVVESKPKTVGGEAGRTTDKASGMMATPPMDSLGAYATKPPSKTGKKWNEAIRSSPPPRRARQRSPRAMRAIIAGAAVALAIGCLFALGYSAQASLDQAVDEKLAANDYQGAVESVEQSSVFAMPFRAGLRDKIRRRAVAAVQDLAPNADDDAVEKTTQTVLRTFPDEPAAGKRLLALSQRRVPSLVNEGRFKDALEKARLVPDESARAELLAKVREPWLAKAWALVLRDGQPEAGRKLIDDLLAAEPESTAARELSDYVAAELRSDASLKDGRYRDALSRLPASGPANLAMDVKTRLAERRTAIRKAWLDSIQEEKDDPRKFDLASDYLEEFPQEADAAKLQHAALPGAMRPLTQAGKFAEARKLLARAGSPVEHVKTITSAWRERAMELFNKNTIEDKDAGIAELSAAATAFPADESLKTALDARKIELAHFIASKVPPAIDAKDIERAKALVARAKMLAPMDPATIAAGLLLWIETDPPTPGNHLTVAFQLGNSFKAPEPLLARLVETLARQSVADPALFKSIKSDLGKITERLPNWEPTPDYVKLFPPSDTPDRIRLKDATALLAKDPPRGREEVLKLNLGKITEADVRREARAALVKLIDGAGYDRDQLRSLDPVAAQSPEVKAAVASAMTVKLKSATGEWPANALAWRERLADCDRANPKDLVVRAIKAEAILQTGGDVKEQLPPGGDEPFLHYVRARIWDKDGDTARAAAEVMKAPVGELAPERQTLAAAMLQNAAQALTPEKDGRRQLFASPQAADNAFAWHTRALALFGQPADAPGVLTAPLALNYALAAACKKEPDFAINKFAGDLFLKNSARSDAGIVLLALSNPSAFANKLPADLRSADLAAMLNLGEAQRKASPENAALRQRQAKLSYLHGRALDREGADPALVRDADEAALALEPAETEYKVAVGRDEAVMALALSNTKPEAARLAVLREGLTKSAAADQSSATAAEMWPELQRARAEIHVQIARGSEKAEAKKAFDAALAAIKKVPGHPLPEDVDFVLGQAHEGLAYQCGIDVDKNYQAAARAYRDAAARKTPYAFTHGRCLVRWATDDTLELSKDKKKELLASAVSEFDRVLKLKDFTMPAQAHFFQGVAIWTPYSPTLTVPKAKDAVIRSLAASAEHPEREGYLAGTALKLLVTMTGYHLKSSPEMTVNWLLEADKSVQSLAPSLQNVGGDFPAALRDYRDLLADASARLAKQYLISPTNSPLFTPNYEKYRANIDRAVSLAHSKRSAEYAVDRALDFKKHQKALGLSADDLNAAHAAALRAVESAGPIDRAPQKKRLDDGWK